MWAGDSSGNWTDYAAQTEEMQNDQVDWASLAKQWIQMKDTPGQEPSTAPIVPSFPMTTTASILSTAINPPPPPPPPSSPPSTSLPDQQTTNQQKSSAPLPPGTFDIPGGEMDMELDDEQQDHTTHNNTTQNHFNPPATTSQAYNGQWPQWQADGEMMGYNNWGWNNEMWQDQAGGDPHADNDKCWSVDQGVDDKEGWNSGRDQETADFFWGNNSHQAPITMDYKHGARSYHSPDRRYNNDKKILSNEQEKEANFQLDAVQRKKLPIWIRHGLERMEKEKLQKEEKDRAEEERATFLLKKREEADAKRLALGKPLKSRFESDSEEETGNPNSPDTKEHPEPLALQKPRRRSRFDPVGSNERRPEEKEESRLSKKRRYPSPPSEPTEVEKEKIMTMMLKRWMTEVLLEVTTELMSGAVSEVLRQNKAPVAMPVRSSGHTPIITPRGTALGGLAMYSDSEEEEEEAPPQKGAQPQKVAPPQKEAQENGESSSSSSSDSESDSDQELPDTINQKNERFQNTTGGIMSKLLQKHGQPNTPTKVSDKVDVPPVKNEDASSSSSSSSSSSGSSDEDEDKTAHPPHGRTKYMDSSKETKESVLNDRRLHSREKGRSHSREKSARSAMDSVPSLQTIKEDEEYSNISAQNDKKSFSKFSSLDEYSMDSEADSSSSVDSSNRTSRSSECRSERHSNSRSLKIKEKFVSLDIETDERNGESSRMKSGEGSNNNQKSDRSGRSESRGSLESSRSHRKYVAQESIEDVASHSSSSKKSSSKKRSDHESSSRRKRSRSRSKNKESSSRRYSSRDKLSYDEYYRDRENRRSREYESSRKSTRDRSSRYSRSRSPQEKYRKEYRDRSRSPRRSEHRDRSPRRSDYSDNYYSVNSKRSRSRSPSRSSEYSSRRYSSSKKKSARSRS